MNEKKIEDYLHLYLGCEAVGISGKHYKIDGKLIDDSPRITGIKPILRPLSSMTDEELKQILGIDDRLFYRGEAPRIFVQGWAAYTPEITRYLLSKHFDLFGLIDSGLSIDATKIDQDSPAPCLTPDGGGRKSF